MERFFLRLWIIAYCCLHVNALIAVSQFRTPLFEKSICAQVSQASRLFSNVDGEVDELSGLWLNSVSCITGTKKDGNSLTHENSTCSQKRGWVSRPWAIGYYRTASETFGRTSDEECSKKDECLPCGSLDCESLAGLWFGRTSFRVEDSFEDAFLNPVELGSSYNPFTGFALVVPYFSYEEKGISFGNVASFKFKDDNFCAGVRVRGSYKSVQIRMDRFEEEDNKFALELPPSVMPGCPAAATDPRDCDFAYRLDFLRSIVSYGTQDTATTVRGDDAATITQVSGQNNTVPVYVVKRTCGLAPNAVNVEGADTDIVRFGKVLSQVKGPLPASGAGADGEVFFLADNVNYASGIGQDPDVQRTLFVVPRFDDTVGAGNLPSTAAFANLATSAVRDAMRKVVNDSVSFSFATKFLADIMGLNIRDTAEVAGIGDLNVDLFFGVDSCDCAGYFITGLVFPTARSHEDPRSIFSLTTGNNNHYELRLGVEFCRLLRFGSYLGRLDFGGFFGHAFEASERKLAPYCGSRVINLSSPCVQADVSWSYYLVHVDLTTLIWQRFGARSSVGYEFYGKSRDRVILDDRFATDVYGRKKQLDSCLLEEHTNTTAHKIRSDVFCVCGMCEWNIGGSYVFSGKNTMLETEMHIGMTVSF